VILGEKGNNKGFGGKATGLEQTKVSLSIKTITVIRGGEISKKTSKI
jgi:hypothetical protein